MIKPSWMLIAEKEINTKEILGAKHNPRIVEYHQTTTLKANTDEVPWCSSFVNWCIIQSGNKGTNLANARSWLNWGKILNQPKIGCIVVFSRGSNPYSGHVGFYIGETQTMIALIGGNQGNRVSIGYYPKDNVLGYRWNYV